MQTSWQERRDEEIRELYERTKSKGGYSGPYLPFRRYVTQADLGGTYVDAPSELDWIPSLPDDITHEIWIAFK
jgi:hypothetical protein